MTPSRFFYGNVAYTSQAIYGNAEYVLNDQWKVFGGVPLNDDHKEHNQNDFSGISPVRDADGEVIYFEAFAILRSKWYDYSCCLQAAPRILARAWPYPLTGPSWIPSAGPGRKRPGMSARNIPRLMT